MTMFKKAEVSEDPKDGYRELMCIAHGCPNRWSVDAGNGKLCSAHAGVDSSKWGQVTRDMAARSLDPETETVIRKVTDDEKLQILRKLQNIGVKENRLWAEALREREQRGEKISAFARECWRDALGVKDDA